MPIYEFACPSCGAHHDEFKKVDDRNEATACPSCGEQSARIISVPHLHSGGEAQPDLDSRIRKEHKLQRGEQVYENPFATNDADRVVHLTGSKKNKLGQIRRALEKSGVKNAHQATSPHLE